MFLDGIMDTLIADMHLIVTTSCPDMVKAAILLVSALVVLQVSGLKWEPVRYTVGAEDNQIIFFFYYTFYTTGVGIEILKILFKVI